MDGHATNSLLEHPDALDRAIQDHQAGPPARAEAAYRRILDTDPNHPDAIHLLGVLACDRGDALAALRYSDTAVAIEPSHAAFHNTRARALVSLGRLTDAEMAYRTAWALRPDSAEIANNLGCLLRTQGNADAAVEWLCHASRLAPGSAEIACNLAEALAAKKAFSASVTLFRHALDLRPAAANAHYRFGQVLVSLGRLADAEQQYRLAIQDHPDHAASHNNLGLVLLDQGRGEAAKRRFQDALACDPRCVDALYNLGCLLLLDGQQDRARDCHEQAVTLDPLHGKALWARCMVELPVIYDTPEQLPLQRGRYAQQMAGLTEAANDPAVAGALAAAAGASQPFFLAYQGNCDRGLQTIYGKLVTRLLQGLRQTGPPQLPDPPPPGEPIRVGIVSGFFREHTVWRLMLRGWLSQFDDTRFRLHAYHTSPARDEQTAVARRLCPRFVAGDETAIRTAMQADRPHVLLYPELGMDPIALRLAAERLAPIQCVAWGHPETSGLPTMDIFLSSDLMEPDDGAAHYSERLIRLPNLGIHYTPDDRPAARIRRGDLGLRDSATIFWCGQALYKYLPQHDAVFTRIAAAAGDCQFMFIGFVKSRSTTEQFRARLRRAFNRAGLDAERACVFLDPMPQDQFLGTIRLSDIMLDSIGWSGGKSTLDALAEDPVIVTHAGPMMRGRHTAAVLTRIGVTETIAATVDDYVAVAVRLARSPDERAAIRVRMAAGRHHAIGDTAPIRALEAFLADAVHGTGAG